MTAEKVNTEQLYNYILSVSLRENPLLKRLREETASYEEYYMMQISPEQGQFIAFLLNLTGARKTLEIGVFTGYSSLNAALVLPPDGIVVACEICAEWASIAQKYWKEGGVDNKIRLHVAPALKTLDKLLNEGEEESFDFVFIDADKEHYDEYYERSLQLLRSGGLMGIDNTLWGGRVIDKEIKDKSTLSIRNLNEKIYRDSRVNISLVPIADGMTLVMKR